jgi:hypothetical protein
VSDAGVATIDASTDPGQRPPVPPPPGAAQAHTTGTGTWIAIGAGVLVFIVIAAGALSKPAAPSLSPNAPLGAVAGTWDAECEAGFLDECESKDGAKAISASDIWCVWRGDDVIVHAVLHNSFGARLRVGIVPRYRILNGEQHGTSFGSDVSQKIDASGSQSYDVNAGHPTGVPAGSTISSCNPKLYDAALSN